MIGLLSFWKEGIIVGLLVAVGVQQVRLSTEKASHAETKQTHAVVLQRIAQKTLIAYQAVLADQEARNTALALLYQKHTKELNDEKDKLKRLRDDVRTGRVGLRVNASCTTSTGISVPQTTSTSLMDDETFPRLTPAAERAYFDLREGIETSRKQIEGLQDYVTNVCLK